MNDRRPTALITGVSGQDGIYLARQLIAAGTQVVGTVQPGSGSAAAMAPYLQGVTVVEHDVRDGASFARLLEDYAPADVFNLAAFSSVGASWQHRELVAEVNGMAVLRMLDALVDYRERHGECARFYQASTSEMFGAAPGPLQTEETPHYPRSPYAVAKSFAHHLTINYRESFGLYACCGILYNHESPVRGRQFVTRKIVRAAAEIAHGVREHVSLGNLAVRRDWGAAPDYVAMMALMMSQDEPRDFIIATGTPRSLQDLLVEAFAAAGVGDPWPYVQHDAALMRPADVIGLAGDASRARQHLNWAPSTSFSTLIEAMVAADIRRLSTGIEESIDYLAVG